MSNIKQLYNSLTINTTKKFIQAAESFLSQGAYDSAIKNYKLAINYSPENCLQNARIHHIIGQINQQSDRPLQSASEYIKAGNTLLLCGYEQLSNEGYQSAYHISHETGIKEAALSFGRGKLYETEGDILSAISSYRQAASLFKAAGLENLYQNYLKAAFDLSELELPGF